MATHHDDLWSPLRTAFQADHELAEALRGLRGEQRPVAVQAMANALHGGYERETLTLLGRLEPYFTRALVNEVVRAGLAMAETHRMRYLLGRLSHGRARELVVPAVSRTLDTDIDADAWMRMAELLHHLGLYDELRELCTRARNSMDPDVREVSACFTTTAPSVSGGCDH